jgi:O-methyltransferase
MSLPSAVPQNIIDSLVALASTAPEGNFIEVGVYQGGTAWHLNKLAEEQNRKIYLYDTFEGIPFSGELDYHKVGDFSDTDYETVRDALPYATVVKGIFPESAVEMENIAFVHLDCDQYQSVIDSIAYLKPKLVKGAIIWFDDAIGDKSYIGTPGQVNGADFAMRELYGTNYEISDCGKPYVIV